MGINYNLINNINKFLLKNIKINFTFLNIVNNKNLSLRLSKRKRLNRYDKFKINFYQKVQNGFINISRKKKNKYLLIDSNLNIDLNKNIIIKKFNSLL